MVCDADIEAAIEELLADMSVVWAGLLLLGGFVAVAVLVAALLITR